MRTVLLLWWAAKEPFTVLVPFVSFYKEKLRGTESLLSLRRQGNLKRILFLIFISKLKEMPRINRSHHIIALFLNKL